jgi:hypothetical protein
MARRYYVVAALLALVGGLGFVLPQPLFGVFEVTPLLNLVHLAAALLTAIAARRGLGTMRAWGQALGYLFAALAGLAFAADAPLVASTLPLSDSNAWFHLVVALIFLYHALLAPPTL